VVDANAANQFLLATVHAGTDDPMRGYIWSRTTGGFLRLRSQTFGRAMCLPARFNDIGDVVGLGTTAASPLPEPMLWVGHTGYTLRELLGGSLPAGWTGMLQPLDINDNGYILGRGVFQGHERHFVMKPVGLWHR
jgi:hypothetical protein